MKIRRVGFELFHTDGQKDGRTWRSYLSLVAIFRQRPKKIN